MISSILARNQHYVLHGRLAQLARALARQARGHWFESSIAHIVIQGVTAKQELLSTTILSHCSRIVVKLFQNLNTNH